MYKETPGCNRDTLSELWRWNLPITIPCLLFSCDFMHPHVNNKTIEKQLKQNDYQ
ncbi:hypothetical protein CHISP_0301 [Chitinispirillum alkaliphilum]|nr:hypothetical protein CHISP_0301 [Chitinispirillum alkaliphilum]